jgi:hypothetical protein
LLIIVILVISVVKKAVTVIVKTIHKQEVVYNELFLDDAQSETGKKVFNSNYDASI